MRHIIKIYLSTLLVFSLGISHAYGRSTYKPDLIGTCYRVYYSPFQATREFVDSTGVQSWRWDITWERAENIGLDSMVSEMNDRIPPGLEKIVVLQFYNSTKMIEPDYLHPYDSQGTYRARDYQEFRQFCQKFARVLSDDGVRIFVMHNEPNLEKWWSDTPESYMEQCYYGSLGIRESVPNAYIIIGAFAGMNPDDNFVRKAMDYGLYMGYTKEFDAVDWHLYGRPNAEFIRKRAMQVKTYCASLGLDWTVLETSGPIPDYEIDNEIVDTAVMYLQYGTSISQVEDSIYAVTSRRNPGCLGLPQNEENLRQATATQFDMRVVTFKDFGAAIVHWFCATNEAEPAWWYKEYPEGRTKASAVHAYKLLKNRLYWGKDNLYDVNSGIYLPVAHRMKEYVNERLGLSPDQNLNKKR